jgi:iron complex outermembrane receptor protein
MRGTASSHAAVSWNGLNINPLTMGQMDFSLLPLFCFEKIAVHAGGESALYGNGAIGGSILLGSRADYRREWHGSVQTTAGSYGYLFTGAKAQGGTEKWQSHTALAFSRSDNDFLIQQETVSGIKKEKQRNAAFWNAGLLQDFSWKINPKNELTVNFWHTQYYREIQPSIQNNDDTDKYENIAFRNTRMLATFKQKNTVNWQVRTAYTNDHQKHLGDVVAAHNFLANGEADYRYRRFSFVGGATLQYILPEVHAYRAGIDEWRADIFLLSKWQILPAWQLSLNLRQGFITNIRVPFTPSVGTAWRVFHNPNHKLSLRANLSRSFKAPTLNDRYWGDLDNRHLKPESGINAEAGVDYDLRLKNYDLQFSASTYYNKVQNWIMWLPRGDIWKPQNIDLVAARGVETTLKQSYSWRRWRAELSLNYAYTLTTVERGFDNMTAFENRQMPLLPRHTANGSLRAEWAGIFASLNLCAVGQRSTTNVFDLMPAYGVGNVSAGYNLDIKKHTLSFSVQLNNAWNAVYETVPFKAMPLRNWNAGVKWIF